MHQIQQSLALTPLFLSRRWACLLPLSLSLSHCHKIPAEIWLFNSSPVLILFNYLQISRMRSASATKKNTNSFKAIITRCHCSVYISSPFLKLLETGSRLYTHIEQHCSLSKYMEKPTKPLESKQYKPKKFSEVYSRHIL